MGLADIFMGTGNVIIHENQLQEVAAADKVRMKAWYWELL